jgi:hypothetical protein
LKAHPDVKQGACIARAQDGVDAPKPGAFGAATAASSHHDRDGNLGVVDVANGFEQVVPKGSHVAGSRTARGAVERVRRVHGLKPLLSGPGGLEETEQWHFAGTDP